MTPFAALRLLAVLPARDIRLAGPLMPVFFLSSLDAPGGASSAVDATDRWGLCPAKGLEVDVPRVDFFAALVLVGRAGGLFRVLPGALRAVAVDVGFMKLAVLVGPALVAAPMGRLGGTLVFEEAGIGCSPWLRTSVGSAAEGIGSATAGISSADAMLKFRREASIKW
jgi:hypothetical protein